MPGLTYRTLDVVLGLKDGFEPKRIEWTWRGQDQSGRNAQIPGGGLNVGMAEENLDGPEIGAGFQHVRRITVPVYVRRNLLLNPAQRPALLQATRIVLRSIGRSGRILEGKSQSCGFRQRQ
jgi:hypothetical protein